LIDIRELDICLKEGGYKFRSEQLGMPWSNLPSLPLELMVAMTDKDGNHKLDKEEFLDLVAYLFIIEEVQKIYSLFVTIFFRLLGILTQTAMEV
jgi:hypothetical protein